MGILNATPDSFSDGSPEFADLDSAVRRALALKAAGVQIVDVGGESTRPGFSPVSEAEELRRVLPVVRRLTAETRLAISVDTRRAAVARRALEAGAWMINDVTAGTFDGAMASVAAEFNAAVCLGHVFDPVALHTSRENADITAEVRAFLAARRDAFLAAGLARERIFLDPGIGFGKTPEQNRALLENLSALQSLGCRLLVGVSRKRFLGGATLDEKDRLTVEWTARLFAAGVDVVRVHRISA